MVSKGEARAERAAKILDKTIPGWHNRIDLDRLKMDDCTLCILGQTFGTNTETAIAREVYPEKINSLTRDMWWNDDGYTVGLRFFYLHARKSYNTVEVACDGESADNCDWVKVVAKRRAKEQSKSA